MASSELAEAAALLGVDPRAEPNLPRVVDWEQASGVSLPGTLRSFYASEIAEALRTANTQDTVVALEDLAVAPIDQWLGPDAGAVTLMVENQSVVRWVVPLNMGDDPPVLVIDDDLHDRPDDALVTASSSIASFLRCIAWDVDVLCGRDRPSRILAHSASPDQQQQLDLLVARFHLVGTTHGWPCRSTYRYDRNGTRILLWACDEQWEWHLDAASDQHLGELVRELDETDALPDRARSG